MRIGERKRIKTSCTINERFAVQNQQTTKENKRFLCCAVCQQKRETNVLSGIWNILFCSSLARATKQPASQPAIRPVSLGIIIIFLSLFYWPLYAPNNKFSSNRFQKTIDMGFTGTTTRPRRKKRAKLLWCQTATALHIFACASVCTLLALLSSSMDSTLLQTVEKYEF